MAYPLSLSLILTLYCGLQGYFLFVQYCRFTHFPYLFRHRKSSFWHALHLGSDSKLQAWHDVCWHGLWQLRDTSATLLQSENIIFLFVYISVNDIKTGKHIVLSLERSGTIVSSQSPPRSYQWQGECVLAVVYAVSETTKFILFLLFNLLQLQV